MATEKRLIWYLISIGLLCSGLSFDIVTSLSVGLIAQLTGILYGAIEFSSGHDRIVIA